MVSQAGNAERRGRLKFDKFDDLIVAIREDGQDQTVFRVRFVVGARRMARFVSGVRARS